MITNNYNEVISCKANYKLIANLLLQGKSVGIGWTDELSTHLDIIFKLGIDYETGLFQRVHDLFVGVIDHMCYGFKTSDIKLGGYIQEKLRMQNETGDKLAELINGIIKAMNESGETSDEIIQK